MGFVNAHYISYITGMGKDTLVASYALATVGITSIIGAIIFGYIADRYNSRYTLAVSYGFRTIGYILLLVLTINLLFFIKKNNFFSNLFFI